MSAFESTAFESTAFLVTLGTDPAFNGDAFNRDAFYATGSDAADIPLRGGGWAPRKSDDKARIATRRRELKKLDDLIARAREVTRQAPETAPEIVTQVSETVAEINRSVDGETLEQIISRRQQLQTLLKLAAGVSAQFAAIEAEIEAAARRQALERDDEDVMMLLMEML